MAVASHAAELVLESLTDDELTREIGEIDRLTHSALERRARLVKAVRTRERHHKNQTTINDAAREEQTK